MKFKLDENLSSGLQAIFRNAGHDVETVLSEALSGATDEQIFDRCCDENRCLITLDLDFADPVRFQSYHCAGIVKFRMPRHFSMKLFQSMINEFLRTLNMIEIKGALWVVEPGRIRIHQVDEGN